MSSFFDQPADLPDRGGPRQTPAWAGPPDDEIGLSVPLRIVLARNSRAAILVRDLVAYRTGFELAITVIARERMPNQILAHPPAAGEKEVGRLLQFGVQFADGGKATISDTSGMGGLMVGYLGRRQEGNGLVEPSGPVLIPRAVDRDYRRCNFRYWVWPLPPPGWLKLAWEWPAMGLSFNTHEIDAAPILLAAAASEVIWPTSE